MMPLIRRGDPLRPFGGEVLEGRFLAFGQRLSCAGDKVRCDKHGENRIVQLEPKQSYSEPSEYQQHKMKASLCSGVLKATIMAQLQNSGRSCPTLPYNWPKKLT